MTFYKISSVVYLDKINKCYKTIVIIDNIPDGPLKNHVRPIMRNKLSPFDDHNNCSNRKSCFNVIYNFNNSNEYLCVDDIIELFNFLSSNDYTIDNNLSEIFEKNKSLSKEEKFICIIKY